MVVPLICSSYLLLFKLNSDQLLLLKMVAKRENDSENSGFSIGANDGISHGSYCPAAILHYDRANEYLIDIEHAAAKELFIEMTYTCARAYCENFLKDLCFDERWFNQTFKESSNRICILSYSACQPLLSKYASIFVMMMRMSLMTVKNIDNLSMLQISFDPMNQLEESWAKSMEEEI